MEEGLVHEPERAGVEDLAQNFWKIKAFKGKEAPMFAIRC